MSPYWTLDQEQVLIQMLDEEKPLEEISQSLHRSVDAIILKAKRLGADIPEKCRAKTGNLKVTKSEATTTTLPPLQPAGELVSLEEMMKTMLGALKQLQDPATLSPLEIKRCRTIVSGARTYMHMLERYEKWTMIEQGLVDMQARFLEHHKQSLQTAKDPEERERLEKEIQGLEQSLQQSAKYYKPFQKKPSLMTPF